MHSVKPQNSASHDIIVGLMSRYSETRDLVASLDWALPRLLAEAHAEAGSMFLHRPESKELECIASVGPVKITGLRVGEGQGLVGEVFMKGQAVLVSDAKNDPRHHRQVDERTGFQTKSILTVPVRFGGRVFGSLQAINRINDAGEACAFVSSNQESFESAAVGLGVALQNLELANDMVRHELIAKDVQAAEETQAHLFPSAQEHPQFVGRVLPARRLSGDFIDVVSMNGQLHIIQGDVAGKGIPASLTVARCLALFRLFVRQGLSPDRIASAMNDELFELAERLGSSAGFVTAFIATFNPVNGALFAVNCGHGDLIRIDCATDEIEFIAPNDPPLGVLASSDLSLPLIERSLQGSRLFVYSDGVSEGRFNGTDLGSSGVAQLVLRLMKHEPAALLDTVMGLFESGKLTTGDDATLMIVGR
jgi:sigma-B regulation protein RsbU (phosphoserine phosphatase)